MTVPQFVFLLVVNALVALVISVVVTLTLGRPRETVTPLVVTPTPMATSAAPQATRPPPTGATTYVVQSEDTLSAIALSFGVSVDDILKANDLSDPDVLYLGQRLIIPQPAPTGAAVATPSEATPSGAIATATTGAPVATATSAGEPAVRIDQVRKAATGTVDDVVVISNSGAWAKLLGWTLVDAQGEAYTFPDLRLFPGGQVRVHTASGKNTEVDLYWGVDRAAWSAGGTVTLKDATGNVVQVAQVQ